MGKRGTEVERERPLFEGQSAEKFIKRWNAITKAIKTAAGAAEAGKEGIPHGGEQDDAQEQ